MTFPAFDSIGGEALNPQVLRGATATADLRHHQFVARNWLTLWPLTARFRVHEEGSAYLRAAIMRLEKVGC